MEDKLITVEELAEMLRTSPQTVYKWRHTRRGPASIKVGRRVLFRESAVVAWLDDQQATTTSAPIGAAS